MAGKRSSQVILFVLLGQAFAQDVRSIMLSILDGWYLQCASTTCLPFATVTTADVFECQTDCLGDLRCTATTFQQSTSSCELFTGTTDQNDIVQTTVETVTMMVLSQTRIPAG